MGSVSCSVTEPRTPVPWTTDLDAGMTGPLARNRSLSHKPRKVFLARDLKTKQESCKRRFKGMKWNVQMKFKIAAHGGAAGVS